MTESSGARGWRERVGVDGPVDIAWLAAFRILFGLTLAVSMARFIAYGWIDEFFTRPTFHFKYWGFGWVEVLPAASMHALFWVTGGLALLVAAGALFRISAPLLVLAFTYLQLIDVTTYLNHYYLASLLCLLLACSPAHRAWSVDAWLRPSLRRDHVPGLVHLWFRFQVGVVYTFAGLAKAHGDWLWHAQPLRIWLSSHTDMPWIGALFSYEWTAILMSWGGFLFDTSVPWFLLWKRTRPYAYAVLVAFHLTVGKLFPIGMFPVIMMLAATVFFDADWPRLKKREQSADRQPVPRFALPLLGVYCALQLLLPIRFLAYGGNVRWHEQGMRFSWRVMVREKNGAVTFFVRNKRSGREWQVSPRRYLTSVQEREVSGQPDLILQLAHHVARDFEQRGLGPVEVRVDAQASLNGRPSAPLIDPTVDLTTIEDGVAQATWILPAPDQAPPHIRPI